MTLTPIADFEKAIEAWIAYRFPKENHCFYSKADWMEFEDKIGLDSELTLMSSERITGILIRSEGEQGEEDSIWRELTALCEKHGYWFDYGYAYTIHFYVEEE